MEVNIYIHRSEHCCCLLGRVYFAAKLALKQLNADGCVIGLNAKMKFQ